LVDFNRTQLGLGINVDRRPGDLAEHCASELEDLRGAYSSRLFELVVVGDCRGLWDGERIEQMVGNLIINAVKYGAPDAPVRITVVGGERDVSIEVVNQGDHTIPSSYPPCSSLCDAERATLLRTPASDSAFSSPVRLRAPTEVPLMCGAKGRRRSFRFACPGRNKLLSALSRPLTKSATGRELASDSFGSRPRGALGCAVPVIHRFTFLSIFTSNRSNAR